MCVSAINIGLLNAFKLKNSMHKNLPRALQYKTFLCHVGLNASKLVSATAAVFTLLHFLCDLQIGRTG